MVLCLALGLFSIFYNATHALGGNICPFVPPVVEEEVNIAPDPILPHIIPSTDCSEFLPLVKQYDWNVDTVMRIMRAESSCYPLALNDNPNTGDYSVGLMQINIIGDMANERPSEEELLKPEVNLAFAYELYNSPRGFTHWSTY